LIFAITPNISIDKTYAVDGFHIDSIHRPQEQNTVAGGKGINVARVYRILGGSAIAGGFIGGKSGAAILSMLEEEEIPHQFVDVKDESRYCIKVMDKQTGTQTEINEPGPVISPVELSSMLDVVEIQCGLCETVAMCGSCPPGVPYSFYGEIIDIARRHGRMSLLDASGEHLVQAVKHSPDIVKPNQYELSHILGRPVNNPQEVVAGALEVVHNFGIGMVVVTLGKDGCIATDGNAVWKVTPPVIKFASAVGSGDSFAAGLLYSLNNGEALKDAIKLATAAGSANAATYGAGFCSHSSIMELVDSVVISEMS
jgi:tagatose 6-phosphate kinase